MSLSKARYSRRRFVLRDPAPVARVEDICEDVLVVSGEVPAVGAHLRFFHRHPSQENAPWSGRCTRQDPRVVAVDGARVTVEGPMLNLAPEVVVGDFIEAWVAGASL